MMHRPRTRHLTQYFEIFGNRAIYNDGWLAGTVHRAAWEIEAAGRSRQRYLGTLRHAERLQPGQRPGEANPAKLKEMQDLFMKEAEKYNVLPIDDRVVGAHRTPRSSGGPT